MKAVSYKANIHYIKYPFYINVLERMLLQTFTVWSHVKLSIHNYYNNVPQYSTGTPPCIECILQSFCPKHMQFLQILTAFWICSVSTGSTTYFLDPKHSHLQVPSQFHVPAGVLVLCPFPWQLASSAHSLGCTAAAPARQSLLQLTTLIPTSNRHMTNCYSCVNQRGTDT